MIQKEIPDLVTLARRTQITEDDWHEMLAARAAHIKEHLRSMTLPAVGDIKFFGDHYSKSMGGDCPKLTGNLSYPLTVRGIFPNDKGCFCAATTSKHDPGPALGGMKAYSSHRFWGFTRNGDWIGVEARVSRRYEPDGRKQRLVYRCEEALIEKFETTQGLCAFAARTPKALWERLGETATTWVRDRESLLNDALKLEEKFKLEHQVVNHLLTK